MCGVGNSMAIVLVYIGPLPFHRHETNTTINTEEKGDNTGSLLSHPFLF